jgi:tRNA(fMet)-specific endonuclease VapC
MTRYLLDTDISSYVIRQRPAALAARFEAHSREIHISTITAAELYFGVAKAKRVALTRLVDAYLERVSVLPWTWEVSRTYGPLRSALERAGTPIGNLDLLIAAHALALDLVLVTNNEKHFSKVPGLRMELWR